MFLRKVKNLMTMEARKKVLIAQPVPSTTYKLEGIHYPVASSGRGSIAKTVLPLPVSDQAVTVTNPDSGYLPRPIINFHHGGGVWTHLASLSHAHVRKKHPWADPKIVKQLIDAKLFELLGGRTAADNEKVPQKKKDKLAKVEEITIADSTHEQPPEDINQFSIFPQPVEKFKVHTEVVYSDGSILRSCNAKELLEKHIKLTGGKVLTRFPPEPNGYLHIGHPKAMFIDIGLAKDRVGGCNLRHDTKLEAEKKEYIHHIEQISKSMGWEPINYSHWSTSMTYPLLCLCFCYINVCWIRFISLLSRFV